MNEILPLGFSEFSALRQENAVYVDKTQLLYDLASPKCKVFLSRPRRFGKTLLLSTLETLFRDGIDLFKGLWIEKHWNDTTYNVVRLDFSEIREFSDIDEFKRKLFGVIYSGFVNYGFEYKPDPILDFYIQLSNWLVKQPNFSLVLLIDEYDAPLTRWLHDVDKFEAVRSLLDEFFGRLKRHENCFRFVFITGITRYKHTTIFSGFNNLTDITMKPEYGALLGYTEPEIKKYFPLHLKKAANYHGVTEEKLLNDLAIFYDGFSFDRHGRTHVFCPWSVLNFFSDKEFEFANYWYQSGGQPTVLMQYLLKHKLESPVDFGQMQVVPLRDLISSRKLDSMSIEVLLQQTGYLSIKNVDSECNVTLGYPNKEVAVSLAQLYFDLFSDQAPITTYGTPTNRDLMLGGDFVTVVRNFNKLLLSLDYHRFLISNEASCRSCFQFLISLSCLTPRIEVHNAFGRSDLEIDVEKTRWVFEIKYAKTTNQVKPKLNEAILQLDEKRYGQGFHDLHVRKVALVFDGSKRQFVAWKEMDTQYYNDLQPN